METDPPKQAAPGPDSPVILWLLDSDPSIRWQVMRDLLGVPAEEVAAERARVATQGWGARLRRDTHPVIGWQGLRGLASVMFMLLAAESLAEAPAASGLVPELVG